MQLGLSAIPIFDDAKSGATARELTDGNGFVSAALMDVVAKMLGRKGGRISALPTCLGPAKGILMRCDQVVAEVERLHAGWLQREAQRELREPVPSQGGRARDGHLAIAQSHRPVHLRRSAARRILGSPWAQPAGGGMDPAAGAGPSAPWLPSAAAVFYNVQLQRKPVRSWSSSRSPH